MVGVCGDEHSECRTSAQSRSKLYLVHLPQLIWCRRLHLGFTQVSTSFYNPVCAFKEYSFPFFGYVRGTSPAHRFEDYVNKHNCYSADIGKVPPIVGDSLDYCVAAITAIKNDKYNKGF